MCWKGCFVVTRWTMVRTHPVRYRRAAGRRMGTMALVQRDVWREVGREVGRVVWSGVRFVRVARVGKGRGVRVRTGAVRSVCRKEKKWMGTKVFSRIYEVRRVESVTWRASIWEWERV